jgi:uncharacterized protein (DUF58 family)
MTAPGPALRDDSHVLRGAYVSIEDLLALRLRRPKRGRAPPRSRAHAAGQRLSRLRGRGIDFAEVRLYQPGDDVRSIDWNVTARKNKPHTKVFREERERPYLVVVDQSQGMFFGSRLRLKSVAAAEIAAVSAWQALAGNDRVGGLVIRNDSADTHKPLRSVKAVARLLADVATGNRMLTRTGAPLSEDALAGALFGLRRLVRTNYRLLFVSDFATHTTIWSDALRELSRHNQVAVVRVFDALERELPPADRYTVSDGEGRWQFHSGDSRLRADYESRFEALDADMQQLCASHAIRYHSRSTVEPTSTADWF